MKGSAENATHILIAEDDHDDYYIFTIAIEEIPYAVVLTWAINGEILLRLMEEKMPDILFLDLMLPGKDGRVCLREIRANRKYDMVPIIIYSSLTDLSSIEYCYREGSNLYAIKPDSIGDLKLILERILSIDWKKTMYFPARTEFVLKAG